MQALRNRLQQSSYDGSLTYGEWLVDCWQQSIERVSAQTARHIDFTFKPKQPNLTQLRDYQEHFMKSFLRWSTALSLVSGVLLGALTAGAQQVLALTDEQIIDRLRPVPVFTITDAEGSPLVASPGEGEAGTAVAGVFISQQDAQNFLNSLREQNPQVAQNVQVVPVSLAEVYQLARTSESQEDPLEFAFVPMPQQVQLALTILRQSGEAVEQFQGVPLFVARSSDQNGGYLTIQQGEQEVIPMFFKQEELQAMLDRLRSDQPALAEQMTIQVVNLEGLIDTLENSENPDLNNILLVPPRETLEFIRSLQSQQQPQPQQAAPQGQ